jgi:hypothetical protein
MDADGNAMAVWTEAGRVYARRYVAGVGWEPAGAIDGNNGGVAAPQVAIDVNGDAIAIWVENNRIGVNRHNGVGPWGAAAFIDGNTGAPTAPQIAIDPNGTSAIAVWSQYDGSTYTDIVASRYTTAGGWSVSEVIDDAAILGNAVTPQIAMAPNGNAVAVWEQEKGTSLRKRIFSSRYRASKDKWTAAELIENLSSPVESSEPQLVVDGQGNALCVWSSVEGGATSRTRNRHSILANRFRVDFDGWTSPILLESDTSGNNGDAISPQLAVAPDYTSVIVWTKANNLDDPDDAADDAIDRYDIQANAFN